MRLGLSANPPHSSPSEWIDKVVAAGLRAVVFPCDETAPDAVIDEYVRLCRASATSSPPPPPWERTDP